MFTQSCETARFVPVLLFFEVKSGYHLLAMISTQTIFGVLLFALVNDVSSDVINRCPQPTALNPDPPAFLYSHPTDRRFFITCAHGRGHIMPCPTNTVWDDALQTCTGAGYYSFHQTYPCSGGAKLVPHAQACQMYYNCSQTGPALNRNFEQFEDECPYPQLFDAHELKCKPHNEAFCDLWRVPAKDPCDYLANQCGGAHCEPCNSRLPSCVGLADGIYQHPLKLDSPYRMRCVSERTYQLLQCNSSQTRNGPDCTVIWRAAV